MNISVAVAITDGLGCAVVVFFIAEFVLNERELLNEIQNETIPNIPFHNRDVACEVVMVNKALIYARCSTDETKQDVEIQLEELRDYCNRQGWEFEEVKEYGSGSKSVPEKLREALIKVKDKKYDIFLVYDLTRFSRLHPSTTSKMMDYIVTNGSRFISLKDNIDSSDEIKWLVIKPLFQYLAWVYSRNLSVKVKLGMDKAKKKGQHCGRPKGSKDKKTRSKKGYYKSTRGKLPF